MSSLASEDALRSGSANRMMPVLRLLLRGACVALPGATAASCTLFDSPTPKETLVTALQAGPAASGTVTLTGVRATLGDAVDCPTIETPDGQRHPVSFLSSAIALGDRVTVRGVYGISTRCRGRVLIVRDEIPEK